MNWRIFLGTIMVAGSAAWYYFHVRPKEIQEAFNLHQELKPKHLSASDQGNAGGNTTQAESEANASAAAPAAHVYSQQELSVMGSESTPELANQIHKPEFRKLSPEKQVILKEILAREIAKGDDVGMTDIMRQIDTGAASESADLFEALTMSTGAAAAKVLIDLAFNATNEDIRKKALGTVAHLYKSRGNRRMPPDVAKIEQHLITALGRTDLADREFAAIIQSLAGFGTAYGIQAMIELWDSVASSRQEIIANEIKIIFQKTAVVPLSTCALAHKQLWKSCGFALAMIGSEESILGILDAVEGNSEKKAESLDWFLSVNKIPAIKTLLSKSKEYETKDKDYFSRVRILAEGLLASLQPNKLQ